MKKTVNCTNNIPEEKKDSNEKTLNLLNQNKKLTVGSHVRIRYLPWHEGVATLMEIKDEPLIRQPEKPKFTEETSHDNL